MAADGGSVIWGGRPLTQVGKRIAGSEGGKPQTQGRTQQQRWTTQRRDWMVVCVFLSFFNNKWMYKDGFG